ncbi:hypothetical protein N752_08010 [Desulforamulus aquiferis]|nr:hypothetical protein [Desulforamulus aquiferis]RYD05828.1 hypothetical protein N752_08010 [Desulforamulus aquiferis]
MDKYISHLEMLIININEGREIELPVLIGGRLELKDRLTKEVVKIIVGSPYGYEAQDGHYHLSWLSEPGQYLMLKRMTEQVKVTLEGREYCGWVTNINHPFL